MPVVILFVLLGFMLLVVIFLFMDAIVKRSGQQFWTSVVVLLTMGFPIFWLYGGYKNINIDYILYQTIQMDDGYPLITVEDESFNVCRIFEKNVPEDAIIKTEVKNHWSWGIYYINFDGNEKPYSFHKYYIIAKDNKEYAEAAKKAKEWEQYQISHKEYSGN